MTEDVMLGTERLDGIVARAADGDERAFSALVVAHHAQMARVAFVITGDREAAADAVQSAWSTAWRYLPRLRDRTAVRAWLVAIAANEARMAVRRRRRRTVIELVVDADRGIVDPADPGDRIAVVDLERALVRLTPDERTLLALRFVADLDSAEIATQLHLSASGVRSRLARLLHRLRSELDHV